MMIPAISLDADSPGIKSRIFSPHTLGIVECRDYRTLATHLAQLDHAIHSIRAVCAGITAPLPLQDVVDMVPRRSSIVDAVSRRLSMNPNSSRRRVTTRHMSWRDAYQFDAPPNEPILHLAVVSPPWWQRTLYRRALIAERVESIQHILAWITARPDTDLLAAEQLRDELNRFPRQTVFEETIIARALLVAERNLLELRAHAATRLFNQALASIVDKAILASWEVLCEEHEAAMLSLPASQIRRSSADTVDISGLDSIRKALEGRVALVDPTAKEDQLKRVLDSVVWFGRAVKTLTSGVTGIASCIFDANVRTGLEVNLLQTVRQVGGLSTFNSLLLAHDLEALPDFRKLAKETKRQRLFLNKCRSGLVSLMTDSLAILGNIAPTTPSPSAVPLSPIVAISPPSEAAPYPSDGPPPLAMPSLNRRASYTLSSDISLGKVSIEADTPPGLVTFNGDISDEANDDSSGIEEKFFPSWWREFNASLLFRKNQYLVYSESILSANAVRRAERERLKGLSNGSSTIALPALPRLSEDDWFRETRRKFIAQARVKQSLKQKRLSIGSTGQDYAAEEGSKSEEGGSLDNLRPVTSRLALSNTGAADEQISCVHFFTALIDGERQTPIPNIDKNASHPRILRMTRQEFASLYQRSLTLRDVCSATIDASAHAISRLTALEQVLTH